MPSDFPGARFGSILIADPVTLKKAFGNPAAYNAIMEYFPATRRQPAISSIPDDEAELLIKAFRQRIQGFDTVSPRRMSTINGIKNAEQKAQYAHILAQLRGRKGAKGIVVPSAKKVSRQKIQAMSGEQKRAIVFKLLWDLFHSTTMPEDVTKSWETILTSIKTNPIYNAVLKSPSSPSSDLGILNVAGIESGTDEQGAFATMKSAPRITATATTKAVAPEEQLKTLYAISHLFNFKFDTIDLKTRALATKLSTVLDVYAAFYVKRFSTLLDPSPTAKSATITQFYRSLSKENIPFNVDGLLTIYSAIDKIRNPGQGTFYKYMNKTGSVNKGSVIIKLPKISSNVDKLITAYTEKLTKQGEDKSNQDVRKEGNQSELKKLYSLNVYDTQIVQIIPGSKMRRPTINAVPDSYSPEEKGIIRAAKETIEREAKDYYNKDDIYLVFTNSELVELADETKPIVHYLLTYDTKTNTLTEAIPSLKHNNKMIRLINNGDRYIDIQYTPTQAYQFFTLPILQLLVLMHLKETLKPATP